MFEFETKSLTSLENSLVADIGEWIAPSTTKRVEAMPWRGWLARYFAPFTTSPFAKRHVNLWEWGAALQAGADQRPFIACWPRGGAKSTTIELMCAWIGSQPDPARHFVLYVSETQTQADKHVAAIAGMLERVGMGRAVNQYGSSKGWRRTELRSANGFNVVAMGLDNAIRGIKLDEYRPDLIVFDDVDGRHDTANRVQKKIEAITTSILPAGSSNYAVVVVQNLVHQYGIMSQLVNGTADFLYSRLPAEIEPAVDGLEYERVIEADGTTRYKITGGRATWEGQPLAKCEQQMNDWGLAAFLAEAQHDVEAAEGGMFKRHWWRYWQPPGSHLPPITVRNADGIAHYVNAVELPTAFTRSAMSWDLTFKGTTRGSFTVGLVGATWRANSFVLDLWREQVEFTGALAAVRMMAQKWPRVGARLIEDKANGPAVVDVLRNEVSGIIPVGVEGSKEARASSATPRVEAGNWFLPHPHLAPWVEAFIRELATFPGGTHDDQVDAFSQLDRYLNGGAGGGITDDLAAAIGSEYAGYQR